MDIKQLEADFEHYIDSCNRLRNTASAFFMTETNNEDVKATNNFSEEYLKSRAKYLDNLGHIGSCARILRDSPYTKSIRSSIQQIKEHLNVTAK